MTLPFQPLIDKHMNAVNKNKWIAALIILLLVANSVTIVLFLTSRKNTASHPPPMQQPFEFLIKEVGLNTTQAEQYIQMTHTHRDNAEIIREKIKKTKEELYNLIKQPSVNDSMISAYTEQISDEMGQLEKNTFRHFQEVRSICTPAQQKKFDQVINQMIQMIGPRPGPPPHPRR